jgi:menaquinone-dependent protoporphyrinogen oxidase
MTKVLVAYATRAGSTRDVADRVADRLDAAGICVDVRPADAVTDLEPYDGIVLGSALYMGRLHADARRFLRRHRRRLGQLPFAMFAMGPRTLDEGDVAGSRAQLEGALRKVPEVRPVLDGIFGGVVDPAKLRFPFNRLPASDARDWTAIEEWADLAAAMFRTDLPALGARDGVDAPDAHTGVDRYAAVG